MKRLNTITIIFLVLGTYSTIFARDFGDQTSDHIRRGTVRVNPVTLDLEFELPLRNYPGRGINIPVNLRYSSKLWQLKDDGLKPVPGNQANTCGKHYSAKFAENSAAGWTTSLAVPFIEYLGAADFYDRDGSLVSKNDAACSTPNGATDPDLLNYIRRVVVHLPNGQTHELRPDDTVVSFSANSPDDQHRPSEAHNWDADYYAPDGSNLRFVQNSQNDTYRLLMPDGSFYDFDPGTPHLDDRQALKYTDRHGNFTTYHDSNAGLTDTTGRKLLAPIDLRPPNEPVVKTSALPGTPGNYKFSWKKLKGGGAAESALTDFSQNLKFSGDTFVCNDNSGNPTYCTHPAGSSLFYGDENIRISGPELFNPVVLTEIELPTGQKYKFSYDVYGRIEKISDPTGGAEHFQYSTVPTLTGFESDDLVGPQTDFGVTSRKVYKFAGDPTPDEWSYEAGYTDPAGSVVKIRNSDGTKLERFLHRGKTAETEFGKFGYENSLAGKIYEERRFNSAEQIISKKLTNWTKSMLPTANTGTNQIAQWHPRITRTESIVYDSNGIGASTVTKYEFEAEADLNLRETPLLIKKTIQYESSADGTSRPANPLGTTELTFLINDPRIPQQTKDFCKAQNLIGLVTSAKVDGLEARIEYDPIALRRPLSIKAYNQSGQISATLEMIYHDEPNNHWVKSITHSNSGQSAEVIAYFDDLGRVFKTEKVKSNGNIFVEMEYDAEGRLQRLSNPFRDGEIKQWKTIVYDEENRIKEVILPDGTVILTDWGVLVSDLSWGVLVSDLSWGVLVSDLSWGVLVSDLIGF